MDSLDWFKPFGDLRGFNYTPSTAANDIAFWRDYDEGLVERELDLAQRLGLNSARVFLAYVVYEREPQAFLRRLGHFVAAAHARGIRTLPVVWDSCFDETLPLYESDENKWIPNPGVQRLGRDFWPDGERYCQDLAQAIGPQPGLQMWDVMNEPTVTTWLDVPAPLRNRRLQTVWSFARHFCGVMKRADPQHPVTVGVARAGELNDIGADVDILSWHDYSPTRQGVFDSITQAMQIATRFRKPAFLSEVGCLARANPYDMTLEICRQMGVGYYIWELMIGVSRWRDIHGVVYPDGSVRDPAIVAALQGFFRKRGPGAVPAAVDKEGAAGRALREADDWLAAGGADRAAGLRIAEVLANLLEAGELIALAELPTARVLALRQDTPANRAELRRRVALWRDALARATFLDGSDTDHTDHTE